MRFSQFQLAESPFRHPCSSSARHTPTIHREGIRIGSYLVKNILRARRRRVTGVRIGRAWAGRRRRRGRARPVPVPPSFADSDGRQNDDDDNDGKHHRHPEPLIVVIRPPSHFYRISVRGLLISRDFFKRGSHVDQHDLFGFRMDGEIGQAGKSFFRPIGELAS